MAKRRDRYVVVIESAVADDRYIKCETPEEALCCAKKWDDNALSFATAYKLVEVKEVRRGKKSTRYCVA